MRWAWARHRGGAGAARVEVAHGHRPHPGGGAEGLVRQWQAEMRLHFGEFQFIEPSELAAFRQWRSGGAGDEETSGACTTR